MEGGRQRRSRIDPIHLSSHGSFLNGTPLLASTFAVQHNCQELDEAGVDLAAVAVMNLNARLTKTAHLNWYIPLVAIFGGLTKRSIRHILKTSAWS